MYVQTLHVFKMCDYIVFREHISIKCGATNTNNNNFPTFSLTTAHSDKRSEIPMFSMATFIIPWFAD